MRWIFEPDSPVFLQIAEILKRDIISGQLKPNEQLPSVRAIAEQAGVNPNTVQRALTALEEKGLIVTRGTVGKFVTDDVPTIKGCYNDEVVRQVKKFMTSIERYGVAKDDVIRMIKEYEVEK